MKTPLCLNLAGARPTIATVLSNEVEDRVSIISLVVLILGKLVGLDRKKNSIVLEAWINAHTDDQDEVAAGGGLLMIVAAGRRLDIIQGAAV